MSQPEQSGPLTFGQLYIWRNAEPYPFDHTGEVNLAGQVAVPAGTGLFEVSAALEALARRHETLRTVYDRDDRTGAPVQLVKRYDPAAVSLVECDAAGAEELAATIGEWSQRQPLDLSERPPWRATVTVVAGAPAHVLLVVNHVAIDWLAMTMLTADLERLLRDQRLDPAAAPRPLDVARAQRSDSWQARRAAATEHWEGLLARMSLPVPPPDWATGTPPRSRWHQPTLRSARAAAPLQALATRFDTSRQNVLLALAYIALWRVFGWERPVLSLMASNRWHSRDLQRLVCCNAQPIPLPVAVEPDRPLAEFVAAVARASLDAYRNGCYDMDGVHRVAGRDVRRGDVVFDDQFIFNYVAEPRPAPAPGAEPDPPVLCWLPDRRTGPNGMLIRDEGTALWFWLRIDEQLLAKERGAQLVHSLDLVLSELDGRGTVRDVADHPGWSRVVAPAAGHA